MKWGTTSDTTSGLFLHKKNKKKNKNKNKKKQQQQKNTHTKKKTEKKSAGRILLDHLDMTSLLTGP